MKPDLAIPPKSFGTTFRSLFLPLLLTFLPVFLFCREAHVWQANELAEASKAWNVAARAISARWERASSLTFWAETAAARFRNRIEMRLPPSASAPFDQDLLGRIGAKALRTPMSRGLASPSIWLFALAGRPTDAPVSCPGEGLQTRFTRLIGSIMHEIDRRNRFEPGRPRPAAWKQSLDRLFGFGVSPELFDLPSRGRAFPVIFQNGYHICVWDFIQADGRFVGVFLMLLPSGPGDADTARRLCFANWRFIARNTALEPVFIPFPLGPAKSGKILVRRGSPLQNQSEVRTFIRKKASEISLRRPEDPDILSPSDIGIWYVSRQVYDMSGEIRLPDRDLHRVFEAGNRHLACWNSLDTMAGGVGLLIGPLPAATDEVSNHARAMPVVVWGLLWLLLLARSAFSGSLPSFGIRSQLAFWFLCLASVPLIIALGETGKLLGDLRGNLLREYDQELNQALQELENEDTRLTRRFAEICNRLTENASRTLALREHQQEKRPVDALMNTLWADLSGLGIPIRSMALFGHGNFVWGRHDAAISPEFGISLVNFMRPMANRLLKILSPELETQVPQRKADVISTQLDQLVSPDVEQLTQKDRQIAETMADNKRMLKFHQFLKLDGKTWFLLVVIWEQSEAYARHIRTRICDIASKYSVDLEITRHTAVGDISIARSGKPLRAHEPGIRSTRQDRIISIRSTRLPSFVMAASRPLDPLRQRLFKETGQVIAGVFGNLLLILLSGGILAAWLTTPLRKMAAALREVASGRLDRRLCLNRPDELGQAADTLDAMTDWLRERHAMSLFVTPQVMEAVATGASSSQAPQRRRIVALTSDIRNFTTISETRPPDEVFSALNRHFRAMTPAIKDQGGIIDRFIGDAIQAVFYEDPASDVEPPAVRSLRAARTMMREHRALQRERARAGLFTYEIGVGLASGDAVCGILGAEGVRLDHSVVGEPVQRSADLEAASKAGRATRIVCDSATAASAGSPGDFLFLSGHPGALEAAGGTSSRDVEAAASASERTDLPHQGTLPGLPSSSPAATAAEKENNTAKYILISILLFAALMLFSFSRTLTSSFKERAIAHEQSELQQDLRLAASTDIPALHIANHLRIILLKGISGKPDLGSSPRDTFSHLRKRLRMAQRFYPTLSWSLIRHLPTRDPDRHSISLRSTKTVESRGIPFAGKASEMAALFSAMKGLLVHGVHDARTSAAIAPLIHRAFPVLQDKAYALSFESYGHFNQCEAFGVNGFLMWEPIVPPGWWDTYQHLIDTVPGSTSLPEAWWREMRGGLLLFLPLDAMDEPTGLRAMTQTMKERGTRLAFLPRGGTLKTAIGSETFDIRLTKSNAVIARKKTNLDAFPEMIAARLIPSPPIWMVLLERLLAFFSCFLSIAAFWFAFADRRFASVALLPRNMVPLLAGAFTLTLLPSLLAGWVAGERSLIERKARLFDTTADQLETVLSSIDKGTNWYIGQNMSVFQHLSVLPAFTSRLHATRTLKSRPEKEKALADLLDTYYQQAMAYGLAIGNMQFFGPGGISVLNAGKASEHESSIMRELYGNLHAQAMQRLSPAFLATEENGDENKRMLENLKGEEIKYLLLSMLSAFDVAAMMSAPAQYQFISWGLNSHESFRIHIPDVTGQPHYAFQVHLADNMLRHQQFRNLYEGRGQPDTPHVSLTRNNPRITLPFTTLRMHLSDLGNRFTADVNSYLAHPEEAAADLLAGASLMPVHTFLEHDGSTEFLLARAGSSQRDHILKARIPYSPLLAQLDREAAASRLLLAFLFFLMLFMSFRTASRFLEPVQALSRAAEAIMNERFDTRLPVDRRDEFGDLAAAFNAMAAGVEEGRRLRSFVSDSVRTAASDEARSKAAMAGENRSAAILFVAPAGFARLLRERSPESVVLLLNRYLAVMSEVIRRHGGEIDKFIGEKILAVFDAESHGALDEATRAAAATVTEMLDAMHQFGQELPCPLGIGIVAGPVLAGIMGAPEVRLEYTVIGDTVNSAARLCDLAEKAGGGTIIDGTAASALDGRSMSPVGEILVKGKARHIAAFRLQ